MEDRGYIVLFNVETEDGREFAVCEGDDRGLLYCEIPAIYAEVGSALVEEDCDPITDLPDELQEEINQTYATLSDDAWSAITGWER